jgi:hypothetical protein
VQTAVAEPVSYSATHRSSSNDGIVSTVLQASPDESTRPMLECRALRLMNRVINSAVFTFIINSHQSQQYLHS